MGVKAIETKDEFYKSIRKGVTMVDFKAPWCAPCTLQEPIISKLATVYGNRVSIYTLNVDHFQDIAVRFGIHSIPTLIIFNNGKERERIVGLQTETVLAAALDRALENISNKNDK